MGLNINLDDLLECLLSLHRLQFDPPATTAETVESDIDHPNQDCLTPNLTRPFK